MIRRVIEVQRVSHVGKRAVLPFRTRLRFFSSSAGSCAGAMPLTAVTNSKISNTRVIALSSRAPFRVVEDPDPNGPFGAKECGQGPLLPVPPAVANAVYDAVGVRIDEVPITPEK